MDTDTDTDTDTIVTTQQLESGVLHPSLVLPQHGADALHVSLAETPVCVSVCVWLVFGRRIFANDLISTLLFSNSFVCCLVAKRVVAKSGVRLSANSENLHVKGSFFAFALCFASFPITACALNKFLLCLLRARLILAAQRHLYKRFQNKNKKTLN